MTTPQPFEELREEFRDFVQNGLWKDEKENFAFFGIDNVADWWLSHFHQKLLSLKEALKKESWEESGGTTVITLDTAISLLGIDNEEKK